MDGFVSGQLPLTDKVQTYLDHCLTCRACETVCPAEVPYGALIDETRKVFAENPETARKNPFPVLLKLIIQHPRLARWISHLLRFYQRSGLQYCARKTGLLKILGLMRLDALLPPLKTPLALQDYYPAQNGERGRVALFTGCMTNLGLQDTLRAAIKVLTACGYGVYVPSLQRCCGALYQHAGYTADATRLIAANLAAFNQNDISAIITVVSGCTPTLQEYPIHHATAAIFSTKIMDISQFLSQIEWPTEVRLKPLAQRIALHTPCSLRFIGQTDAPMKLLQKIPAVDIVSLDAKNGCCGAAGLYMLQQTEMADQLLAPLLAQLATVKPDYIVTSNIGCSLHMMRKLRGFGYSIPVLHPISLLAKQLF